MSTKKSHRTREQLLQEQAQIKQTEHKSVIAEFQAVVDELRERGMTAVDLHSILNMIFQGWLVAGQPTREYLDLAAKAIKQRELAKDGINVIDTSSISSIK